MVVQQTNVARVAKQSEVNRLMRLDTTPWYRKPNLRRLYLFLVPSVLGCEMTSGYDGSILNGLQAVQPWLSCMFSFPVRVAMSIITMNIVADYLQTLVILRVRYLA